MWFLLGLLVSTAQVSASAAEIHPGDCVAMLTAGERSYLTEGEHYTLDEQTIHDLSINELLFPVLNKTRTWMGAARLSWLLRHPYSSVAEINRRQSAVHELAEHRALYTAINTPLTALDEERVRKRIATSSEYWTKSRLLSSPVKALMYGFALYSGDWKMGTASIMWTMFMGRATLQDMTSMRNSAITYRDFFKACREIGPKLLKADSEPLREIGKALAAVTDSNHPDSLARVANSFKSVGPAWLKSPIDAVFDYGAWTLPPKLKRLKKNEARMAKLMSAVAELDVYLALADYSIEHGAEVTFPAMLDGDEAKITIEDGHNPYLKQKLGATSVPNSLVLDSKSKNFAIITGSNMGGKSTFMRMVGLLGIQGQIGAKVPAKSFVFTPVEPLASFDIRDSIADAKSYYDAETDRMLELVRKSQQPGRVLLIMDEIFLGTNAEERAAIENSIIREMTASGKLHLLSTHEITVTELEGQVPGVYNLHIEEGVQDGKLKFTHRVVEGPAPESSRVGIKILEMKGYPESMTAKAREFYRIDAEMKRRMKLGNNSGASEH